MPLGILSELAEANERFTARSSQYGRSSQMIRKGYTMSDSSKVLTNALIGLGGTITNAMNDDPEFVPCGRPAGIVMGNVAALGQNLSDEEYAARAQQVTALMEHVGDHHGAQVAGTYEGELTQVKTSLLDSLIELTDLTLPMLEAGAFAPEVNAFFYRSLAALAADDAACEAQLAQLDAIAAQAKSL